MAKLNCPVRMDYIGEKECREYQRDFLGGTCLDCPHCYKNKATYILYQRLRATEGLLGRIEFVEDGDYIRWTFHDNLTLSAVSAPNGLGYIEINDGKLSINPYVEEIYENLVEIGKGDVIFVTKIGLAGRYISGMFTRKVYEEKRERITFGIKPKAYSAKGAEPV